MFNVKRKKVFNQIKKDQDNFHKVAISVLKKLQYFNKYVSAEFIFTYETITEQFERK